MGKPLYELVGAYGSLWQQMEDGQVVDEAQLDALGDALEHKGAGIVHVLAQLDADESLLRAELERLAERKRVLCANRERLREYIKRTMLDHQVTRLKAGTFSISVSEGAEKVVIDDETRVPDDFMRVRKEPNKTAILEAWKNDGELVPGVHIERAIALRIR